MKYQKEFTVRGWRFKYSRRTSDEFMGRFGGGWNWKIGVQWGNTAIIFSLLIVELSIRKPEKSGHASFGGKSVETIPGNK